MDSTDTLDLRREGAVLTVTLNQPATRNALSSAMVQDLEALAQACHACSEVRAIVLRGAGGNFCAGGNFADFQKLMATPPPQAETAPRGSPVEAPLPHGTWGRGVGERGSAQTL